MTNLFRLVALMSFRYKYLLAGISSWKWRTKVIPSVIVTDVIVITLLLCTDKGQTMGSIIIGSFRLKKSPGTNKLLNQLSIFSEYPLHWTMDIQYFPLITACLCDIHVITSWSTGTYLLSWLVWLHHGQ